MKTFARAICGAGVAAVLTLAPITSPGQDAGANLPGGVQDVVKLVKAGLGEEVVLAHIRHTGATYSLSADQIIFLHGQGVSQSEITALLGGGNSAPQSSAPAALPMPSSPAPAVVSPASAPVAVQPASLGSFQSELSPYGSWLDEPGYGLCWRPSVEATDPFWRPYFNQGHWVYTADGWAWQSDYPWGDVVFHYGRWYRDAAGWVWVPGYDWAPAWVCWRHAEGYCGWAPLPPGAVFRPGVGLWFNGRVAVDVDFGLGMDAFTFVAYDHFWDHNLHPFLLPLDRLVVAFGRSVIMNGYRLDHGRFIVEGLGRERIASFTHREVRVEEGFRDARFHGREGDRGGFRDDHRDHRDR